MSNKSIEAGIEELAKKAPKVTLKSLQSEVDDILARLTKLESKRGPASTREMTVEDARRIRTGDLADESHKVCAETLGLSYGQVYSCRGGYTFKKVANEVEPEGFIDDFEG